VLVHFRITKKEYFLNTIDLEKLENEQDALVTNSEISELLKAGRKKSFLTDEDILAVIPDAEHDLDLLDQIFSRMLKAGIRYVMDESEIEDEKDDNLQGTERFDESVDPLAGINAEDTISIYFREVGSVPLLSADEEVGLAQRIEMGRTAREELASGNIPTERRAELFRMIQDGTDARDHLIIANSRLVISIAKKYMRSTVSFLDLIQEGNIGLMRAIKKFDYRRGFKFSTYATWWIRQAITRAIDDHSRTIRIPVHMNDRIRRMNRARNKMLQNNDREPTTEELAQILDVSLEDVLYMQEIARRPISIHMQTGEDDDAEIGDFIENKDSPAPEEQAAISNMREQINAVLAGLPEREVRVLRFRFGLSGEKPYTLHEIGQKMGVTRERVRQIAMQGLQRLRQPAIRNHLKELL
jgi:RNA polymerase primary sigma factor